MVKSGRGPIFGRCFVVWMVLGAATVADVESTDAPFVSEIQPRQSGRFGATKLTITGGNFSPPNPGTNKITLVSDHRSYDCEYQSEASTTEKLMCYTVPMKPDTYVVKVAVNGEAIESSNYCNRNPNSYNCRVYVSTWTSPYIHSIFPGSGAAGDHTEVCLRGVYWTDAYGSNTVNTRDRRDHEDNYIAFKRGIAGSQECKITTTKLDSNSDWGDVCCKIQGTEIGGINVNYIISGIYGRTGPYYWADKRRSSSPLRVNSLGKIESFQQYAVLESVSPATGSVEGGTELTITGRHMDNSDTSPIQIHVSGVPCTVTSFDRSEVKCRTGPKPAAENFAGNRGVRVYKLTENNFNSWTKVHELINATLYPRNETSARWVDKLSFCDLPDWKHCKLNFGDYYATVTRGYFVPPWSGQYQFLVKGDDRVQFRMSLTGPESDQEEVGYTTRHRNDFNGEASQVSSVYNLTAGKPHFLSVAHADGSWNGGIDVAVRYFDMHKFTTDQTSDAVMERQTIKMSSTRVLEQQTVVFDSISQSSGRSTVQKVTVTTSDPVTTSFRLCVSGLCTGKLKQDSRTSAVQSELAGLPFGFAVSVSSGGAGVFKVTFGDKEGNIPKMTKETEKDAGSSASISVSVSVDTEGTLRDGYIPLTMGGNAFSKPISIAATEDTFKTNLQELFKPRCSKSVGTYQYSLKYYEDFDGSNPKNVGGSRTSYYEPFCGTHSVRNPKYLIRKTTVKVVPDDYLCFAYKAPSGKVLVLAFSSSKKYQLPASSGDWQYTCIAGTKIIETVYPDDHETRSEYSIWSIYMQRLEVNADYDFFIDQVAVSPDALSTQDASKIRIPPVAMMNDVKINKSMSSPPTFHVTLDPHHCANSFKLFGVRFGQGKSGSLSSNNVKTADKNWGSGKVVTSRDSSATGPLTGSFTVSAGSQAITVPVDMKAADLRNKLESALDDQVDVELDQDKCYGREWEINWQYPGGNRPTITITSTSSLSGNVPAVAIEERDGHIEFNPIPGDFLRTAHDNTQLSALVNGLPTKCDGDCSFAYSQAATPSVSGVTVSARRKRSAAPGCSEGETLTLSGTTFDSTTPANNVVTLGDAKCTVTSATSTELQCTVGAGSAGTKNIAVNVLGKGLATSNATYEYKLCVTGIDPSEGSIGGGLPVTISGSGFSSQSTVTVGSVDCPVKSATATSVVCIPKAVASERSGNLTLTEGSETATCDSCSYTFKDIKTPLVTATDLTSSHVSGGDSLTITGTGLGTNSSTTKVTICGKDAAIQSVNATKVVITLPKNGPECCTIHVFVDGKGYGDVATNNIPELCYKLKVTGVSPLEGSNEGGTRVTILGEGFGTNETKVDVTFGSVPCTLETVADDQVVCLTGKGFKVHKVDHLGNHPKYGIGYLWNPSHLTIEVGDTVEWQWAVPDFVDGLQYSVQQTADETAVEYDGSGFKSETGRKGIFRHQFLTAGTYYYWSDFVISDYAMRGVVKVNARTDTALPLTVMVDELESEYNVNGGSSVSDSSACPGSNSYQVSGCSGSKPTGSDAAKFNFAYWSCKTPTVSSVSVVNATSQDKIVINGKGFATTDCQNEVKFGDTSCTVSSSTASKIKCNLDTSSAIKPFKSAALSLRVGNTGYATTDASLVVLPHISSVSPTSGSLNGGTKITITGEGLSYADALYLSPLPCAEVSKTYTQIVCQTVGTLNGDASGEIVLSIGGQAIPCSSCSFSFEGANTPTVTARSPHPIDGPTQITLNGTNFGTDVYKTSVLLGDIACTVVSVDDTQIVCNSSYLPVGTNKFQVHISGKGVSNNDINVWNRPLIYSMAPSNGSTAGGTRLVLSGNGFVDGSTTVTIGGEPCAITSISLSEVRCTTPAGTAGSEDVVVKSKSKTYPTQQFEYTSGETPTLTSVTPTKGVSGQSVTIAGNDFGSSVEVTINSSPCTQTSLTNTEIQCTVGASASGVYDVYVYVDNKGFTAASSSVQFTYELSASSMNHNSGSTCGGHSLTLDGAGFVENSTSVTICGKPCPITSLSSSQLTCVTPPAGGCTEGAVAITVDGKTTQSSSNYTYDSSKTPVITSIDPSRGGTAGGTQVTITGTGFSSTQANNVVDIGGSACTVMSSSTTEIVCTSGARTPSKQFRAQVVVEDTETGKSCTNANSEFLYIDRWSSVYTWGGVSSSLPTAGDIIVIPEGQVILLDGDYETPQLQFLIIEGALIFEDPGVGNQGPKLNAINILINKGGLLQVGTKETPYMGNTEIVLHGHQRSQEIPVYGTKNLGVRNGTLDLHGRPTHVTWTLLASTAAAGTNQVTLQVPVEWQVGDTVVIPTTNHRHSQSESETRTITAISVDKKTLTLDTNLEYTHIGETRTYGSRTLELRGEVGLLSHNVKVRGSEHADWNEVIEACPDGFNTGEFATQTCFQGRFGEEMGSDEFGGHILIHPAKLGSQEAIGRISYVELTYVGQAFRLGRYPIHFHLLGDVLTDGKPQSYVIGCAIHRTFNRAVNMHNTHNLLIEHNVVYNVMGGAIFLEDGIETGNIIQYNLAAFVKASSSLLNDDITPASYWVTNPNNTLRHNHACGGTHFGFWYRMHQHPDGPSFDANIFPRCTPLGIFFNNTVHSMGWFGIWLFQDYYPMLNADCSSGVHVPAVFDTLITWHNEKGAEFVNGGAMTYVNNVHYCNSRAGFEGKLVVKKGAEMLLVNSTLAACETNDERAGKDENGIVLPWSDGQHLDNVEFVNFNETNAIAVAHTRIDGTCKNWCGGFDAMFKKTSFVNSPNRFLANWQHEGVLVDEDGSLVPGSAPGFRILPCMDTLPSECSPVDAKYVSDKPMCLCDSSVKVARLAMNKYIPDECNYKDLITVNENGNNSVPWAFKRLTHKEGWMLDLLLGIDNDVYVKDCQPYNISYTGRLSRFVAGDWLKICHQMPLKPDRVFILDGQPEPREMSDAPLTYEKHVNGDWTYDPVAKKFCYFISAKQPDGSVFSTPKDINIKLSAFRCYYPNCEPPPDPNTLPPARSRPEDAISFTKFMNDHGSTQYVNNDLTIQEGVWVVRYPEEVLPTIKMLRIEGSFELDDSDDHTLFAENILILGRMVLGWEDAPFKNKITLYTSGRSTDTPFEYTLAPKPYRGPPIGSNAIAVFGGLDAFGLQRMPQHTQLAATADAGATTIQLNDAVEWVVGDEIAIATTSFRPGESEKRIIDSISSDKKTLTLTQALTYRHTGSSTPIDGSYIMAAEVAVLTRNIKFTSDPNHEKGFGMRILVSSASLGDNQDTRNYRGYARIQNVEFFQTGQEGYTENYDPHFVLAYLNPGAVDGIRPSYVKGVGCNDVYSPCIGAFGADKLKIHGNSMLGTVGGAIRVESDDVTISSNVLMGDAWPGGWDGRFELSSLAYDASIEAMLAENVVLQDNIVAGADRLAYHVKPPACGSSTWRSNVGHSCLTGVGVLLGDKVDGQCIQFSGFFIYKAFDYGFYIQAPSVNIKAEDVVLAENGISFFTFVSQPAALSHQCVNKKVFLSKSTVIGTSDLFDCSDKMDKSLKTIRSSGSARGIGYGSNSVSGSVGITLPTFSSGGNGMPFKPWKKIMSYPALCGEYIVSEVHFKNFATNACGMDDIAISSNPKNGDYQHPLKMSNITTTNVQNFVKYGKPNAGLVNPSDCVDMICDATKEFLIDDTDGSFTSSNSPVTIIPKAEDQWDGQPRYGLGDYRIPKTMLTDPKTGSKIDAATRYPNKGHYRGSPGQCSWNAAWNAYSCTGLNYKPIVIESMDSDTETRRLSPVALATGDYIDLINGPADHGWCSGYTCQKRISTFQALMAMNRTYDVFFTGVSPQKLRLFLMNAQDSDIVRVAIYYSTPLRLDVHSGQRYMYPTNAAVDGTMKNPTFDGEYFPKFDGASGSNYFDRDTNLLYILIKGGADPINIKAKEVVVLSLTLPPITVDEFFGANLVNNIALFLGVPANKIRIVNVVSESGRRRRSTGGTAIQIEIGDKPDDQVAYNETTSDSLSFQELANASSAVITGIQSGSFEQAVNITIVDAGVIEPLPPPDDPLWNDMTSGDEASLVITVQKPASMSMVAKPVGSQEGSPFTTQPSLQVYDAAGNVVKVLGSNILPWTLKAKLRDNTGTDNRAKLLGTTTIPYKNGWFNFTDLFISHSGSGYVVDFEISSPAESVGKFSASSDGLTITEGQLKIAVVSSSENKTVNSPETFTVEIQDHLSGNKHHDIAWKGHTWQCSAALSSPAVYNGGQLSGTTTVAADPATSCAVFSDLSFSEAASYYVTFTCLSTPSQFMLTTETNAIIAPTQCSESVVEVNKTATLKFNAEFSAVETRYVSALVRNHVNKMFCDVVLSDFVISQGSVVVVFVMSGNTSSVNSAVTSLANEVKSGLSLSYGGVAMPAFAYMKVDGSFYNGLDDDVVPLPPTTTVAPGINKTSPSNVPIGAIIGGVVGGVIVILVVIIVVIWLSKRKGKRVGSAPSVSSSEEQASSTSKTRLRKDDYELTVTSQNEKSSDTKKAPGSAQSSARGSGRNSLTPIGH